MLSLTWYLLYIKLISTVAQGLICCFGLFRDPTSHSACTNAIFFSKLLTCLDVIVALSSLRRTKFILLATIHEVTVITFGHVGKTAFTLKNVNRYVLHIGSFLCGLFPRCTIGTSRTCSNIFLHTYRQLRGLQFRFF